MVNKGKKLECNTVVMCFVSPNYTNTQIATACLSSSSDCLTTGCMEVFSQPTKILINGGAQQNLNLKCLILLSVKLSLNETKLVTQGQTFFADQ